MPQIASAGTRENLQADVFCSWAENTFDLFAASCSSRLLCSAPLAPPSYLHFCHQKQGEGSVWVRVALRPSPEVQGAVACLLVMKVMEGTLLGHKPLAWKAFQLWQPVPNFLHLKFSVWLFPLDVHHAGTEVVVCFCIVTRQYLLSRIAGNQSYRDSFSEGIMCLGNALQPKIFVGSENNFSLGNIFSLFSSNWKP